MKLKERLIKKLVEIGRKHRILVYPTLALIAVISAVSNAVYWGKGNGKRVVASITVLVLLFTQSLFLTSSANTGDVVPPEEMNSNAEESLDSQDIGDGELPLADTENSELAGDESVDVSESEIVDNENNNNEDSLIGDVDANSDNSQNVLIEEATIPVTLAEEEISKLKVIVKLAYTELEAYYTLDLTYDEATGTYSLPTTQVDSASASKALFNSDTVDSHISYTGLFTDDTYQNAVTNLTDLVKDETNKVYVAYAKAVVDGITVNYIAKDDETVKKSYEITIASTGTELYNQADNILVLNLTGSDSHYGERKGYLFSGVNINGEQHAASTLVSVPLTAGQTSIDIKSEWTAKQVDIICDVIDDSDPLCDVSVNELIKNLKWQTFYDADLQLWDPATRNQAEPNDGYVFDHWEYNGTNISNLTWITDLFDLVPDGVIDYSQPILKGVKITGIWKYKDYKLTGLDADGGISGTYGDDISYNITAEYASGDKTGDKFGLLISDAWIADLSTNYGIRIEKGEVCDNPAYYKSYKITAPGGLTAITGGAVDIPISVCDLNKPTAESVMDTTIPLSIAKREVTIIPDTVMDSVDIAKAPHKSYDGNTDINVQQFAALDNLKFNDNITAVFDKKAAFNDANAGSGKTLTLKNVSLSGDKASNYEIITYGDGNYYDITGRGIIEQKPINVYMKVKDSDPASEDTTVKYGQANPEYVLYLSDEAVGSLTAYDKSLYESNSSKFFADVLKFSGFTFGRDRYSAANASYSVIPKFSGDGNYIVNTTNLEGSIAVTRDAAIKDTNFTVSEKQTDTYYRDITISPTGDYNQIRLCSGDSDDVTDDTKLGGFKSSLTYADLGDMTDETIYIQLRDSSSGAITNIGMIDHLNIDKNAPKLIGFDIKPNDKLNIFNFGAYYKPQNDVNIVTFTFIYETDNSDCDFLHYYFEDKDGNRIGDTVADKKLICYETGKFKTSITMSVDDYGQLIVFATDVAGNTSAYSRIKIDTFNEFASPDKKPSDYYEWMVENTKTDASLEVTSAGATASTDASIYYNMLELSVNANDVVAENAVSGVNRVEWKVTDAAGAEVMAETTAVPDTNKKYDNYTFMNTFPSIGTQLSGAYNISAVVYDNAGNSVELGPKGPYNVDTIAPVIEDLTQAPDSDSYSSGVMLELKATEGEAESGLSLISLYKKDATAANGRTELISWSNFDSTERYEKLCSYNIKENGTYVIVAVDMAGNVKEHETVLTGISDIVPDAPSIEVVSGMYNDSGWYMDTKPNIKINTNNYMSNGMPVTSDNVPLRTDYTITVKNAETDVQRSYTAADFTFSLDYEGEVTVTAVNISASNKKSAIASSVIKVDTVKPVIEITGSTIDTDGRLVIEFKVSDATSGVDLSSIMVNGELIKVNDPDAWGNVTGSFTVDDGKVYTITATDKAGNEAIETEYKPLSLYVSPVTDITTSSALLKANIEVGTYKLGNYYVAYKKHSDSKYVRYNLIDAETTADGLNITCPFRNLSADTVYDYKIYAVADTSGEAKAYEGSFKTGALNASAVVYGNVTYADELADSFKTYPVYVTLFKGDAAVGGICLASDEETEYYFKNVADGSYQITATNGVLSRSAAVTIENGGVIYPSNYLAVNGIKLVLSGLSTSVDIQDDVTDITADKLEFIYDEDFSINITDDDYRIVNEGGNIMVTLHARSIDVSESISSTEKSVIADRLGDKAEVVRYLELYITKTVTDVNGISTTSYITELLEPITVSFPLGDLAGQKLYVASLHKSSIDDSDYDFYDWSSSESATVSRDYVTIRTSRFSVYALYKLKPVDKYYTVKWVDGDGYVIKTESIKSGEAATPPTAIPTKKATEEYNYIFDGWDTGYACITGDTIIAALFKAEKIEKPEDEDKKPDNTEEPKAPDADIDKPTKDETDKLDNSDNSDNSGNRYSYLGSVESPATGDSTPVVVLSVLMIVSLLGAAFILHKRNNLIKDEIDE